MGAINRVPKGFLGLLDAKTQGRTPTDPSGVLAPTVDLTPFYLFDIPMQVTQAASGVIALTGATARVTVPDGEAWAVYGVGFTLTAVAATAFPAAWAAAWRWGFPGGTQTDFTSVRRSLSAITAALSVGNTWNPPLLVTAGAFFEVNVLDVPAGGQFSVFNRVTYRKLVI